MVRWTRRIRHWAIRSLIQRMALKRGFIDPFTLLGRLRRFSRPSEVGEPVELLRAGVIFHARGLINTKAIQQNLDWVWPWWIEQQFNPHSLSFIPRAFSISHINQTHRNWTALGLPGRDAYPLVDPRGWVTPLYDGWSLDAWIIPDEGEPLFPSRAPEAEQRLLTDHDLYAVRTKTSMAGLALTSVADIPPDDAENRLRIHHHAEADRHARLVIALRPANPEGISFIRTWSHDDAASAWIVNGEKAVHFDTPPRSHHASRYGEGDVRFRLDEPGAAGTVTCDVEMLTAAAIYRIRPGEPLDVSMTARTGEAESTPARTSPPIPSVQPAEWQPALEPGCNLSVPDTHWQFLCDAAIRSLLLLTPGEIYPGPYTYRRFWFRDAALMLNALLTAGYDQLVRSVFPCFPERQLRSGYFRSQDGEWDSNGEVLWILQRYECVTGERLDDTWHKPLRNAAEWILRKRTPRDSGEPHAGLMPAGFSAEHLGPNDHYYWDNFWSEAGLRCAADMAEARGWSVEPRRFRDAADMFALDIRQSLEHAPQFHTNGAIPASPYRRMDSGAVGSLCASYPLHLLPPDDPRLAATADWLMDHARVKGGFFQDMIHSGINAYLTLHLAQTLLRNGDMRCVELVHTVADLASPTGQWPEAIHPHTLGGCMGDGHHGWASAEWLMMIRNMILREEGDRLLVGSGIPRDWLDQRKPISLAGTLTPYGRTDVDIRPRNDGPHHQVTVKTAGRNHPETLEIRLPGCRPVIKTGNETSGTVSVEVEDT